MPTTYAWPLTAIRFDGQTIPLPDADAVRAFDARIRRANESWSAKHREHYHYAWPLSVTDTTHHHWVVRDDLGRIVTRDGFNDAFPAPRRVWYAHSNKAAREAAAKGLPIPGTGCSKAGWKINHTAKKNSGSGHRNRNRARAIYDTREYEVPNNVGNRVIPWEGC